MASAIDGEKKETLKDIDRKNKKALKDIWENYDGQERLADSFVQELVYFLNNCPELITKFNKKIETEESYNFADVAKHCRKLLKALEKISDLDRRNLLSLREKRPEYGGKNVPICDPFEYVQTIEKFAKDRSYELKRYRKYGRQLDGLRDFLNRFPPLRNINYSDLIKIARLLWDGDGDRDGIKDASFKKVYRPGKK